MKKILYFIMIFVAIAAVFSLTACEGNGDDKTNIGAHIPYVENFTCDYYDSDNNQVDQNNVFSFDSVVLVKITFTLSAEANKVGKSKFTLKLTPSEGFTGRIVSANTSLTNNKDLTATFAADDKSKNCEIQAEIQFNYNSGELRIEYAYDDEEYELGGIAQLRNHQTLKFEYDETTDGYIVSAYPGQSPYGSESGWIKDSDELIIPDVFNGKPVTALGENAFSLHLANLKLKKIVVPHSVTRIGDFAFQGFDSLTEIVLPDSITHIGDDAFYGCSSLTELKLPDKITTIGDSAFAHCYALQSITLPYGVTSVGVSAFSNCSSLRTVSLPDTITEIKDYAFAECLSLTDIRLPIGIQTIGRGVFDGAELNCNIFDSACYIGNEINAYLYLLKAESQDITACQISSECKFIGRKAFYECGSLENVIIPDSVKSIDGNAFEKCKSLTNITLPDGISVINYSLFSGCSSLESLTLPDGVTSIGNNAFYNCINLTNIMIPDSVMSVGIGAFDGCDKLYVSDEKGFYVATKSNRYAIFIKPKNNVTSIKIHDNCKIVGSAAFMNCSSLESVILPDSVKSIGSHAFYGCKNLKSITLPAVMLSRGNERTTFFGCYSFLNVVFGGTKKEWLDYNIGEISATGPITVYCSDGEIKFKLN